MNSWAMRAIRSIGLFNVILGVSGLTLAANGLLRATPSSSNELFYAEVKLARLATSMLLLLALTLGGLFLLRAQRKGVSLTNVVLGVEMAYLMLSSGVGLFLSMSQNQRAASIGNAMAATAGTGNIGLAPQMIIVYPVVALIVLNLAYRRLRNDGVWVQRPR